MIARICCLLFTPKSPKLVFVGLLAVLGAVTLGFLYFADFRQLFHAAVLSPSFEEHASFEHNVPRYRPHSICPFEGINTSATIFVISPPENVLRRQVVRSTWGHPKVTKPLRVGVVFVLGESNDPSVERLVDWEAEVYGDIVQTTFDDNYASLPLKTLMGLKWVLEFCSKSDFVVKVDDDVFINVYALNRFLRGQDKQESSLMCLVWDKMPVIHREGSKKSSAMPHFNGTIYPPYCSGSAYTMSIDVARSLHKASSVVPTFWLEDVYVTGILANHAGISHKQIGYLYAFKSRKMSDLAEGKIIFAHLDEEKPIPEARMWEEVFAYENNRTYRTSLKESISMREVVT